MTKNPTRQDDVNTLQCNAQKVYAGFVSAGDWVMDDNTAYKVEFVSSETGGIVLFNCRDILTHAEQDLRYRKYTDIVAVVARWAHLS